MTAVLVVTLGRLGDIFGRVGINNLGFVVFTIFSIALRGGTYRWSATTAGDEEPAVRTPAALSR